jgi:uncharacterized membrane protein YkoI
MLILANSPGNARPSGDFFILANLSPDAAAKIVVRNKKDRVLAVKKQMLNGREVYIIKVLSPDSGRIKHYKVDVKTGARL